MSNKIEGLVDSENIITYTPQDPTEAEKESARGNIGVVKSTYNEFTYSKPETQSGTENRQVLKLNDTKLLFVNNKDNAGLTELRVVLTPESGFSGNIKLGLGIGIIFHTGNEISILRYSETNDRFERVFTWKQDGTNFYLQV